MRFVRFHRLTVDQFSWIQTVTVQSVRYGDSTELRARAAGQHSSPHVDSGRLSRARASPVWLRFGAGSRADGCADASVASKYNSIQNSNSCAACTATAQHTAQQHTRTAQHTASARYSSRSVTVRVQSVRARDGSQFRRLRYGLRMDRRRQFGSPDTDGTQSVRFVAVEFDYGTVSVTRYLARAERTRTSQTLPQLRCRRNSSDYEIDSRMDLSGIGSPHAVRMVQFSSSRMDNGSRAAVQSDSAVQYATVRIRSGTG